MKITVLTTEYNPLHNGHVYHIRKTREHFPDNYLVGVMSGSFTLRGEPAILDKFTRARHAILAGLDAVIELPAFSSFLNGELFAKSSMSIAKLIDADSISFGSECGNVNELVELNDVLENPSDDFQSVFQSNMAEGKSYPRSLCETFSTLYPDKPYADILNEPNNNLALMYLKAIKDSVITPFTVKRSDTGFHSDTPTQNLLSASGIRKKLLSGNTQCLSEFLPDFVLQDLLESNYSKLNDFSTLILFKLRTMPVEKLAEIFDVAEGLENRFVKCVNEVQTLDELLEKVKSKRYTLSRLKRILLCALFDVTKSKVNLLENLSYGRLLAVNKEKTDLLSHLKSHGIITRYSELKEKHKPIWDMENSYSDTHALLLGKILQNRNTLFI